MHLNKFIPNDLCIGLTPTATPGLDRKWITYSEGPNGEANHYRDAYIDRKIAYHYGEYCTIVSYDVEAKTVSMQNELADDEDPFTIPYEQYVADFGIRWVPHLNWCKITEAIEEEELSNKWPTTEFTADTISYFGSLLAEDSPIKVNVPSTYEAYVTGTLKTDGILAKGTYLGLDLEVYGEKGDVIYRFIYENKDVTYKPSFITSTCSGLAEEMQLILAHLVGTSM